MADHQVRLHRNRAAHIALGDCLVAEKPEDELVLIDDKLREPEWVTKMASKVFRPHESQRTRYKTAYPEHDATTPSLEEFCNGKKPRYGR